MRIPKIIFVAAALSFFNPSAYADDCRDDTVSFNFDELEVKMAFALIADFAKLTPNIDPSIPYSAAIRFKCVRWEVAARNLADKYDLILRVENRTLYVSKK